MLEEKARRLIEVKEEYDRIKEEYIRLREEFHNELLNSQNRALELRGYRITLVDDTIRRELDRALLERTLKELGLSEDEIISIIVSSRREIPLSGAIKIIRI
ncbi:MAG TPA: hypothetical protein VHO03_05195 [Ignavibacteriales bacterium]|nr:hypothetical protein [Ignavibacteriales bacterium]